MSAEKPPAAHNGAASTDLSRPGTEPVSTDASSGGLGHREGASVAKPPSKPAGGGLVTWLKETAIVFGAVVLIMAIVRLFVFQLFVIPSGSMENTLEVGDRIAVPKFLPHHRGDVVVFADPGDWLGMTPAPRTAGQTALQFLGLQPDTSHNYLVKRIVGMPGDRVACCSPEGKLTVNGVAIDESAYLYREGGQPIAPSDFPFEVVVPAGHVFVLGDHRNNSDDSRCHLRALGVGAFVPEDRIQGVAAATVFPFDRLHRWTTPAVYAGIPAPDSVPADAEIHADKVTCG